MLCRRGLCDKECLVLPAGDRQHAVDGVSELGVGKSHGQGQDDHQVDEVHRIGPGPHVRHAQQLGGNPGEPGKQHVHDEGPVEEGAAVAARGVLDAHPQEIACATDQQRGEDVAQHLERVAQRKRVSTSRQQEQ